MVKKSLQTVERCARRKPKIQISQFAVAIHKPVDVFLQAQVFDRPHFLHQRKKVVIAAKENVQPHFYVIAARIRPTAYLAAHKRTRLEKLHLVPGIDKPYRRCHAC